MNTNIRMPETFGLRLPVVMVIVDCATRRILDVRVEDPAFLSAILALNPQRQHNGSAKPTDEEEVSE